ncbi:MAG TPA: hypothetical protein VEW71_00085 [Allosphingosinicella sp.]|nr:hypothetical protein [Allosphingosinicella sp.]
MTRFLIFSLCTSVSLVVACSQSENPGTNASGNAVSLFQPGEENVVAVEPLPPNYAPAIEAVLVVDRQTSGHGNQPSRVTAMRAIDLSATPTDFRQAFLEHVFAWERRVRAQQAWTQLTSRGDEGEILVGGILCEVLACPENPIANRLDAEARLQQEMRTADGEIGATYREVQRIAVHHGANPSAGS